MKVKGKDHAVRAYEPLCTTADASTQLLAEVSQYHAALDSYFAQRWDEAHERFEALHAMAPHALLYGIYLERIADLRALDLPADWDGSFQHLSK